MNKIAEILRAVLAAMGRLVTRSVSTLKCVGGRMVQVAETVVERVYDAVIATPAAAWDLTQAAAKLGLGAASDAVKLPFRLAGAVFGGRRPQQPTAQQAAADEASAQRAAQQHESDRQAAADRQSEARELVQAVRSVAAARARGERLDDVALGRLPEGVRDYILALDREECAAVASASVMGLRGVLKGRPPEGVRSPKDIRESTGAEVISEEQVAARRQEVRASARAAMRGRNSEPVTEVDAVLRSLTA